MLTEESAASSVDLTGFTNLSLLSFHFFPFYFSGYCDPWGYYRTHYRTIVLTGSLPRYTAHHQLPFLALSLIEAEEKILTGKI